MTYHVLYGDTAAMASRDRHLDERVQSERFSTEHEALMRARERLDQGRRMADPGPRTEDSAVGCLRRPPQLVRAVCPRWSLPCSGALRCARASPSNSRVPAISAHLPVPEGTSTDAARAADRRG